MPGDGTWGDVTTAADEVGFTIHMMDASGDTWTERIAVVASTTLAAIQAWVNLYQAITNSSIWKVTRETIWQGDADPDNAVAAYRGGVENGINLSFRDADTGITEPIRLIAPLSTVMQGNQDIPLLTGGDMDDFILATLGLMPDFNFATAQYTVHRERRGNPKVK